MKKALPVLQKSIFLNGKRLDYTWARKPIKNVNLRIHADGSVNVSSPLGMPQKAVEEFLFDHADFILSAQKRFEMRRAEMPAKNHFQTGETLLIFGKKTPLRVLAGKHTGGRLTTDELVLTAPDPENEAQRKRAAELWAKEALKYQIAEHLEKATVDFSRFSVPVPAVKYRNMRSRWGSCNTKKAILTFNLSLIGAPKEAIEYVVYHEFAHLVHPNHSAKFYALVERFLPDWKARKAMLRAIPCGLFQTEKTPF